MNEIFTIPAEQYTVSFTKRFVSGTLNGLAFNDSLTFPGDSKGYCASALFMNQLIDASVDETPVQTSFGNNGEFIIIEGSVSIHYDDRPGTFNLNESEVGK
jgi:hypothetical protein